MLGKYGSVWSHFGCHSYGDATDIHWVAFDHSAAISPKFLKLVELGGDVQNLHFEMRLNGKVRQSASTAQMIFTVDQLISHISQFVTLKIGDLIYTGTPVGVGEVREGDELTATLEGHELLNFDIR